MQGICGKGFCKKMPPKSENIRRTSRLCSGRMSEGQHTTHDRGVSRPCTYTWRVISCRAGMRWMRRGQACVLNTIAP